MPDARVSDDNQFLPRRRYNDQRIVQIRVCRYVYIYIERGRQRRRHLNLLQLWTRLLVSYIFSTCRTNKN